MKGRVFTMGASAKGKLGLEGSVAEVPEFVEMPTQICYGLPNGQQNKEQRIVEVFAG